MPREGQADAARRAIAAGAERGPGRRTGTRARPPRVLGLGPEPDELRGLGRTLQDLLAGHAVAQDLPGRGRVAGSVDVPPSDLERRDIELFGDPVEVRLGRELGLRSPESAKRAVGRRVRPGRPGADADIRAAVRPAAVQRSAREHDRGQGAVRAAVHHDLDVLGYEPAIAGDARPVADDRGVALRGGGDVLVALVDHPHGFLGLAREERRVQPDDRGELLLAAEATAGLGLDDAGGLIVEAQTALQGRVEVVRALQRARNGDAATVGGFGDHRVVLDVQLLLVTDAVLALEDDVGAGEGGLDVGPRFDRVLGERVVRLERIEDAGQLRRPRQRPVSRLAQGRLVGSGEEG